jgi:hypothetical protein
LIQNFSVSSDLAADLAGARVDPNEAQKALAYLRSKRDAKLFFAYLRAIVNDGRAVIRSGQTLGYYRDLLSACERHLRGMPADEMAQSLGWAIRLLRYYRAVPDAEIVRPSAASRAPQSNAQPARHEEPAPPQQPTAPQLPAVGDTFASRITAVDETVVLVEIRGFSESQAIGVLKAEAIEGGRTDRYHVGNSARVEVIGVRALKSGRMIVELKPARRENR